jgi:hypothetical protein
LKAGGGRFWLTAKKFLAILSVTKRQFRAISPLEGQFFATANFNQRKKEKKDRGPWK